MTEQRTKEELLALPRTRSPGWRCWLARLFGVRILAHDSESWLEAYAWRGKLYVTKFWPPDANFLP